MKRKAKFHKDQVVVHIFDGKSAHVMEVSKLPANGSWFYMISTRLPDWIAESRLRPLTKREKG